MVLKKNFYLQLTKMEKKYPLDLLSSTGHRLHQRMSNVTPAYDERMSSVLSIRSHTLKLFEHVQKN